MQSTRYIRRQIQSTKNTAKITKAMEMVSAAKMRKSQEAALIARPYAEAALKLLGNISNSVESKKDYPLLMERKVEKICLLVATSDKGLCGGLNSTILKEAVKIISENQDKEISLITIGKKAEKFFRGKQNILAVFENIGDTVELGETLPISKMLMDDFLGEKYDRVIAVYTNFVSTLKQEAKVKNLLPVTEESFKETLDEMGRDEKGRTKKMVDNTEYLFEPSAEEVLKYLLPALVETQVFHVILESNASEHSARMVAMKNATDNAKELLEDLKLSYNYARQQKITQEMTEIAAGVTAQEG
ncbi:MAG: ATP synthase F1 subunit gamma [Candidatus Pacebacteria bacterium]|nr:ATP synthase F1 subunit gamma [Candidatus Paceibacterota bacterium]